MFARLADPGIFEFAKPSLIVKESAGKALIPVERSNGCDGKVMLKYSTEDMTAVSGKDFEGGENTLTFEHGETTKCIEITIYDDQVGNCVRPSNRQQFHQQACIFYYGVIVCVNETKARCCVTAARNTLFYGAINYPLAFYHQLFLFA